MIRTTSTKRRGHAFVVIHRTGDTWHSGWGWQVHTAIPMQQLIGGARTHSVGPCLHRGTAPFRVLATMAARNHADRIQF